MSLANQPTISGDAPKPGVWYPFGIGHRIIFDVNGTPRIWDCLQWQYLGDQLYSRIQYHLDCARNAPDGNLMEMTGWGHITAGKLTGMFMAACSTVEVVNALGDDKVLVPLLMMACAALE